MTHSVDNVPSQQAVKLVVVRFGFVEQCWFRLFLGDQLQWKKGVNCRYGFAISDANTKNCPLKYLIFQTNEEIFTFVIFKTDVSIKWTLMNPRIFFLKKDLTFQVRRDIKLPISARDWHVLVARFSKNKVYIKSVLKSASWNHLEIHLNYYYYYAS